MGKIRNIVQSLQDREIVKIAPDLVVYFEGFPYLQNYYLTTNPSNPVLVNHNTYVTAFSASYDTDQMIPTCNITLAVPAHERHLFQAPGGNNLIKTMMQVQVYVKGYYFASDGNTLFNRVFKGFTSHVTHSDDGKTLLISIQCSGILGFLEMMQIDLNPALQSSSPAGVVPFTSILYSMSPYQQLAFVFLYPSSTDGFYTNALGNLGSSVQNTPEYAAILANGFAAKWQTILAEICQESHIYGLQNKDIQNVTTYLKSIAAASPDRGTKGWSLLASQESFVSTVKESDSPVDIQNISKIQQFVPDLGIASIQLINGRVVSRLEFLRTITHLINYECYQDVDGEIIIKPPLYNLDVTNLGTSTTAATSSSSPTTQPPITTANNPFIVHLSEISNESETEDQGAVRATRMVIQGNTSTDINVMQLSSIMRATAEFTDLPKLSQFGLREEPARTIPWLLDNDKAACFAQAAAELALSSRGYRTYAFSIPLRPELKLGFPMFIPHRDMYGYVKTINIQIQIGGEATMTVTLDTLRKRAMFPQAATSGTGTTFVSQPNLVLKWVQTPPATSATTPPAQGSVPDPTASPANQIGRPITITQPSTSSAITSDQQALIGFQQQQMGSYYAISADTKIASWQVQPDSANVWSVSRSVSATKDFNFYTAARTTLPYTDQKGYEVVTPFPWGRWIDVNTALQEFTRDGYIAQPSAQDSTYLNAGVNTFLYAGLTTPISSSASSSLSTALAAGAPSPSGTTSSSTGNTPAAAPGGGPSSSTSQQYPDITVFELSYSTFSPGGAGSIIQVAQPDSQIDSALITALTASETQKVNMFLTGTPPAPDPTLAAQEQAVGNMAQSIVPPPVTPR